MSFLLMSVHNMTLFYPLLIFSFNATNSVSYGKMRKKLMGCVMRTLQDQGTQARINSTKRLKRLDTVDSWCMKGLSKVDGLMTG